MILTLTALEPRFGESVWVGYGTDEAGVEHRFGIDHRPAMDIAEALDAGEENITVSIEPWQHMGVVKR